ncbi:MAG: dihydroneopterin aldolase [Rickettsiales bacterium]|jgi:dihydroneopterin aldolase
MSMVANMSSKGLKHRWRVHVKNLETSIGVGIHAHEIEKQRVRINVTIEGEYPAKPQLIEDCFNYDYINQLVMDEWSKKPHKLLLENCVVELLEHIFICDKRVDFARVHICKPDIFPHAESVGAETEWTREDFENFCI